MARTLVALILIAAAGPDAPPRTRVSYDRHADFSALQTYGWARPLASGSGPLAHQRLVVAIDYHLSMRGLRRVDSDPDVRVTYHSDPERDVEIEIERFGYRLGPAWYWGGGMGFADAPVHSYAPGTLVIDVWDARRERLLWRGTAAPAILETAEQVASACRRLFDAFPPGRSPGAAGGASRDEVHPGARPR